MDRLSAQTVRSALEHLPEWEIADDDNSLQKVFRFKTFRAAMAFVNSVAEIATQARHHPDILIRYNRVTLTLTTHEAGGLTERDLQFARDVEARLQSA